MKLAARSLGGMVLCPPVSKAEAERVLLAEIPDDAWRAIERAFREYGEALDALTLSKASRKKDDPQSWHVRQSKVTADLERALNRLEKAQSHGEFLREASENYSLQTFGYSAGLDRSAMRKV